MEKHDKKINKSMMIGWSIITVILIVAYFGEYIKGTRTGTYMLIFSLVTVVPLLVCLCLYFKNKSSHFLRYFIVIGYSIMYVFVLLTGNTSMVFTYIFPLLTLIVLYHQPKLVLIMGIVSLLANVAYDVKLFMEGAVTLETSRDIEIQLALIILCFGSLYVASRMYDNIQRKNNEYLKEIEDKTKAIQSVTLEAISTIANIIDAKDEYTQGHSQRVSEYATELAKQLGYSDEEVENIRYIALLHDIGKIGIPDSVLKKTGRLTDEEYNVMKQHVDIGNRILKDNTAIKDLAKGAKYHHERYDGTGYTEGLKGENIPEIARIISIADAYDAMTSTRVYRPEMTEEQAVQQLIKNSGTQFDPAMVEAFLRILDKKKESAGMVYYPSADNA
ncbi:MAG: HD domain-containing phosphohydrolase [Candidatus Coproplasma sp.]